MSPFGRLFHIKSSVTDLRYDGGKVIEESEAFSGALRKRFVHGSGVDEPLVVYDASGAKRWFHADERGSIIEYLGTVTNFHPRPARDDRVGTPPQVRRRAAQAPA